MAIVAQGGLPMLVDMSIPDVALEYILYQRTDLLVFAHRLNALGVWQAYRAAVRLEATLRKRAILQLYTKEMLHEYEDIRVWLPHWAERILDIGCGIGGINVFLFRHYGCHSHIQFYLLDKTSTNRRIYYGFRPEGAFYNSLDVTKQVLCQNDIPAGSIHTLEVMPDSRVPTEADYQFILSLRSWGFHYPVSRYVDQAYERLQQDGRLIVDIRKGTGGEKEMGRVFGKVQIISEGTQHIRIVAIK